VEWNVREGRSGGFAYNGKVGQWWAERAADCAHRRAYANIADFIRDSVPREPQLIVDYACGPGNLLSLLSRRFPRSRLAGLDRSSFLLGLAEKRLSHLPRRCARRISLIETPLPGPAPLSRRAELAVFCFPNMMLSRSDEKEGVGIFRLSKMDREIAESVLRAMRREGSGDSILKIAKHALAYGRSISKNLRSLLVRGGICVRAEYATTRRHEWSPAELMRVSFEEGSFDTGIDGNRLRPWFRMLASAYFRSRVMEDVFQQTGDEHDKQGGYLITVLRAL